LYGNTGQKQRLFRTDDFSVLRHKVGVGNVSQSARKLKALREGAGLTVRATAKAIGRSASSYAFYEDEYKKPYLPMDLIKSLEKVLVPRGVGSAELYELAGVTGIRGAGGSPRELLAANQADASEGDMVSLDELDIRAVAGFSGIDPAETQITAPIAARWSVPQNWLRQIAPGPSPTLKIITVVGDSMIPEFQPNQRVLVDISDKIPTPSGIFVVWDGLSVSIKRVHFVPFSDPHRVVISSINTAYPAYERLLGEAFIQARVIGRWQPT
jgi:DNA-binding XRE family transcriptional regulator